MNVDDTRAAMVYRRRNGTFVVGEQRLENWVRVAGPPYLRLAVDVRAEEVGQAVARALAENARGVSMRDEEVYERTWVPVLELVGVRTSSEFHAGTSAVKIDDDGGRVAVYATDNRGSSGGFVCIDPPAMLREPSHEELGQAVVKRLLT
jgi:hypothetical protein